MALPVSASFTGTNGTAIRTLADWDGARTDAINGGACAIQSNTAQAAAGSQIAADWWTSDTPNANQVARATVTAIASGAYIGVGVRLSGTDNTGNLTGYLFYSDSADGCYIDKIVSGSWVASIAGPGAVFAVNDTLELSINGTALTAKVNGTTRLTATDSAISSGSFGIAAYANGASAVDNFEGDNLSSGSQTISANAISSAATVYQPAVTPGAVTVSPNAISSAATVYQPAVSQGGSTQTINANAISSAATVYQPAVTPGAVTVAPNVIASTATVYQLSVSIGAVTIAPNAIASTATVRQPAVTPGVVTVSPNAIASAATVAAPWVLYGASVGGVLTVNATNGRYFENDTGPIVLAGFHTWQLSGAENSDTDPPAEFDFDEFLTALTSKGVNFSKLWAMETPEDWPNLSPMYFAPLPWARTGPGTAADGKPKFDLTTFDQDYFDRMRVYAVRLGNAGIYCAVQFFQGWHVAQKGYSVGTPGVYHPFNAANNINSIDGDTDNDGDLVESRDTSLTSIYNLQKAYVEKVIDTLNDLDHIIWEVENEGESDLTWQRAIAAYVKSYEAGKAKQHPVGLTKLYPGGSNSDLYASSVEWTSIDDDYPTPVPDEADGSMVILWDTDHVLGLTTDWRLSWMSFTRGNNPVYMDEWNGWTYGTDRRADTSAEKYRNNLGYILGYVARVDIVAMTPQGSLSSTGYAIANTEQILAYQPSSGNFTVDLSGFSGTYAVEYLRTGTGATSTGTTVSGGAVRTMVAPWASEDFAVFLDKLGDEILPNAIASTATVYQPAVTSTATIAPNAISSGATVYQVAVAAGAVTISPSAISSTATVYQPTVSGTGLLQPNPTLGSELMANPGFETAGAGGSDIWASWTETVATGGAIADETSLVHAGSHAAKITAGSSGSSAVHQDVTVVSSAWYLLQFYTRGDGTNAGRYQVYDVSGATNITVLTSTGVTGTTYGEVSVSFRMVPTYTTARIRAVAAAAGTGGVGYFDDYTLKRITLASTFSTATYGTHGTTRAAVTVVSGTQAGVVANLDSASSPANFVIATHDGTTARLTKCVGGTYTELVSASATYSAGAAIEIRRLAGTNTYQLWYNGSQVGANQTISDVGITSNTLAGYFNTYSGNTLTSFASVQTVDASTIASTASVYQPAVTSTATIVPSAIASTATVQQPAVTPGAVTVSPNAIASTATVHQPAVLIPTERTIYPDAISSTAQLFTVAITAIVAGRINRIAGEDRTWAIDAEDRTYSIGE